MQNMRKNMDPKLIQQMGGMENIMKMGQQMGLGKGGGGGMPDMGSIMKMMQGMGMAPGGPGGGGMPDMGGMMQ